MDIVTLALAKNYADSISSGITSIKTENNKLIFILQNGNIIEVPLTDLVDNVVTEEELLNKLKNYIKNTDFASAENAGIIKVDATSYATELDNGKLKVSTKTYENYKDMNNEGFIGKGTLENVLIGKKLETTNNKVTFVDEDSTDIEYPSAKAMYKVSNKLDTLKNDILETGTNSDTFIHLEDSAMAEYQELSVDGVCEQETTSGKNLLESNLLPITKNGITISKNDNGDIVVNGTITGIESGFVTFVIGNTFTVEEGTYTSSVQNKKDGIGLITNGFYDALNITMADNVNFKTATATEAQTITPQINIRYDAGTFNNYIFNPMIEKSSTANKYEPYTGGQPSPNPDYPQEIKVIENSLKIRSNNFNYIFGIDIKETLVENVALRSVNNGIINIKKTTEKSCNIATHVKPISVKAGDKINIEILKGTINGFFTCRFMDKNWNDLGLYNPTKEENLIKSDGIVEIIMPHIPKTTTFEDVDFVFALNVEESLETQIEANLPEGEFIAKINDTYKDTLKVEYNEEDGQYHLNLYKNIGKIVLDGSENWVFNSSKELTQTFKLNKTLSFASSSYLSNYFKNLLGDVPKIVLNMADGILYLAIYKTIASSTQELKTWLSTHNTEIYYVLANHYVIDLGVVDMPITYNETTNLFTDSDLLPQINAKYYRNFTSTIQNIQVNNKTLKQELVDINNRLDALESEINIESYVAKIDEINGEVI